MGSILVNFSISATNGPLERVSRENSNNEKRGILMPLSTNKKDIEIENHFANHKLSSYNKSLLKKKREAYNPARVELMDTVLYNIRKNFPKDIVILTGSYDYDQPLDELLQKVADGLSMSKDERENLNFYNENFASFLAQVLSKRRNNLPPSNELFWYDVRRLLFKWMLYIRQSDNDSNIKKASLEIQLLIPILRTKANMPFPSSFDLKSMIRQDLVIFKSLIRYEFFENPHIFHLFASIVKGFYGKEENKENRKKKGNMNVMTCQKLKSDYFNETVSRNNKFLLKFMILIYDPLGEIKKCFPEDKYFKILPLSLTENSSKIKITREYIKDLKFRGPENLDIFSMRHLSNFIIDFFIKSKRTFKISNIDDFIVLKRKLIESKRKLSEMGIPLDKLIEFRFSGHSGYYYKWDKKEFEIYLEEASKEEIMTDINSEEWDNYIKSIN